MKNVKIFTFIAVALAFAIAATISRRGDRGDHHTESDWLSMSNEVMKGN